MAYRVGSETESLAKLFIAGVALALVITLLGGWFAASQTVSSVDQGDLGKNIESLGSYATEGSFLADQYVKQRPTANYTSVSALKLRVAVSDLAQQLQGEQSDPSIAGKVQKTINYADELSKYLAQLSLSPQSRQANYLNDQIHKLQGQIKAMADNE
jgi:K+-transporting ATPase c subunit